MNQGLKILMISSDRNVLASGSAVSERMKEYGKLVGELHIVLLSDSAHGLKENKIGENVWVYPTNSSYKLLRPLDAARIGKRIVLKNRFVRGLSLVTADSLECGWAGRKVKKRWRIPMELQIHADIFSPQFSGFQNWVRKLFARSIIRDADSVRVVSEDLKSRILNLKSGARVSVLPIYVDKEKIENSPINFDVHSLYPWHFILFMACRLEPEKNIELALQALALVRQRFLETGLIIAGSGSEEEVLKSKARSLKLEGAVEFVGWQEDLASFYKTSNAFLQTSHFEGYGLSLVEAGLSGLPVITTPVGITSELTHGKDAYIYPANAELFAAGIIDLIENNQKRENLRENLKRTLESKLISKAEYLDKMKENWIEIAKRII